MNYTDKMMNELRDMIYRNAKAKGFIKKYLE